MEPSGYDVAVAFQTAPTGRTLLGSNPNNYPQPVLHDRSNNTAMERYKTPPPSERSHHRLVLNNEDEARGLEVVGESRNWA